MNYVASSFGAAWTNFVSSQAVSVNTGSNAGRYIVGISTATNGGTAAARNLSSANYGGVGLTLSAVESNNFGSYFQAAHGATTLTGANNFTAVCPNNDGGIFVAAAAFDGCAASPLSGLVKTGADNSAPSATVSSAAGRTVYAILAEIGTQDALRRAGLGDDVVACQAVAQTFQLGGRGRDIGFRRGFRQFDHDLFQRDQAGGGAVTLVAQVKDIDAAIDDDGVRQLARLELFQH
jgi:hypothetical protein